MQEWKTESYEEAITSKGASRFGKLRLWFIVLLVLGIGALIYGLVRSVPEAGREIQRIQQQQTGSLSFVGAAHAQDPNPAATAPLQVKPIIMAGIFLVLGIVLLIAIYQMLFSDNKEKVVLAGDVAKTLLGFFVGVGTNFFNV